MANDLKNKVTIIKEESVDLSKVETFIADVTSQVMINILKEEERMILGIMLNKSKL